MVAKKRRLDFFVILITLITISSFISCREKQTAEPADLILINGKLVTVDDRMPEATWIAVRGDRVSALGSEPKGYSRHIGERTEIIDLNGALTVPGLIESHGHFISLGASKMILDLTKAHSWDDILEMVAGAASTAKPGEWILGRGWHQDKWDRVPEPNVNGLPVHDSLSKATPKNPVLLIHASGHSALANAKAMESSKITRTTTAPDGGEIIRDAKGNPIGAFLETAQRLVRYQPVQDTPDEGGARLRKQVELASRECLSHGITTFHDAGASFKTIDLYKRMAEENALPVRLYVMLGEDDIALAARGVSYRMIGAVSNHLTVRAIKRLIDGALGAHGAWLLEPYTDLPASTGLNTQSVESMKASAKFAIENGFQLATHAIGDRANRETLDIYEEAFKAHPDKANLRWRIEHAQHLSPPDIQRFSRLGVIPAMQAIHCTSDAPWVYKRLGEKRAEEGAYVWRKLMAAGSIISNGTDVPVEPIDPMSCFYAAVTRKLKDGTTFFPDQKMTREEALRAYTMNGAYAGFEENLKGSLTPGKLADITVLTRDILTCREDDIPGTEVLYTIIGGKILYHH